MPSDEEEAKQIKLMSMKEPMYIFERIRQILNELMFLTDLVDDEQFEKHPQVLAVLIEDYSQLTELVMARGLVADELMDPEEESERERSKMPAGLKAGKPGGLADLGGLPGLKGMPGRL